MFEPILLAIKLIKFLFTHLIGTILLAVVGSLFLCGGCVGVVTVAHESAPTKVSLPDLETKGLPKPKWLEISDGYVFWPQQIRFFIQNVQRETAQGTTKETVVKEQTEMYCVPLVSKNLLDQWLKDYQEKGDAAVFDYEKCRVILKIKPEDFEKHFPGVSTGNIDLTKPYTQVTVTGEARTFDGERADVRRELANHTANLKWEQMTLLHWGSEPVGKGGMACLAFFGLLWFVPLGICLVRRFTGQIKPTPTPT